MTAPKPMLAKDVKGDCSKIPAGWKWQPKFDGWRFLFHVTENGVRSYCGRNGSDRTGQAPDIDAAFAALPNDTIIDCELIAPGQPAAKVATRLAHGGELEAYAFDVLRRDGVDLTHLPQHERRVHLTDLVDLLGENVYVVPEYDDGDVDLLGAIIDAGFEGIVAKDPNGPYVSKRDGRWLKCKPQDSDEATIVGFIAGKAGRAGDVGAFQIKMLDSGVLTSCATLDDEQRARIKSNPQAFLGRVIEVNHHGIMKSGKPRHPVFNRLREDREPVTTGGSK